MHDGHDHDHTHEHSHAHPHDHSRGEIRLKAGGAQTKQVAIMTYMLDHNRSHAAELGTVADELSALGMEEAAWALREGVALFGEGNAKLETALELVKNFKKD